MRTTDLPITQLHEAPWNPNVLDETGVERLRRSLDRFGFVQNLVVRSLGDDFEVLSGNQRLRVLRESGTERAACVVVDVDDANARLLAQALNRIHGEDDLGLRAELVKDVLRDLPTRDVLALLPETTASLDGLASMGSQSLADGLAAWQRAQAVRLRHLQVQLTTSQLEVVDEALERVLAGATNSDDNPNRRGYAVYLLARAYLERSDE